MRALNLSGIVLLATRAREKTPDAPPVATTDVSSLHTSDGEDQPDNGEAAQYSLPLVRFQLGRPDRSNLIPTVHPPFQLSV